MKMLGYSHISCNKEAFLLYQESEILALLKIMNAVKIEARKVIDSLPEDTSYDEILKELVFDRMIKNGLQDSQKKLGAEEEK